MGQKFYFLVSIVAIVAMVSIVVLMNLNGNSVPLGSDETMVGEAMRASSYARSATSATNTKATATASKTPAANPKTTPTTSKTAAIATATKIEGQTMDLIEGCSDSDGGDEPFTKGAVTVTYQGKVYPSIYDVCEGEILNERFCGETFGTTGSRRFNCGTVYKNAQCISGKCVIMEQASDAIAPQTSPNFK